MDYNGFVETMETLPISLTADAHSLYAAFEQLADGRKKQGKQYPLALLLTLLVVAKSAGETTLSGCAHWLRLRKEQIAKLIRLHRNRLPCANTYTYALKHLDAQEVTRVVQHFFTRLKTEHRDRSESGQLLTEDARAKQQHVALDGKTLRGTLKHEPKEQEAVHLLSLYEVTTGIVLAQGQVNVKENEISAAPALLTLERVIKRIVTADALHTQKKFCLHLKQREGEYVLMVKDNHPTMRADLELFFEDPEADRADWRTETTWDKGHGRLEKRTVTTSSQLNSFFALQWAGIEQVFRIERIITCKGVSHTEIVYGLTSLSPRMAGPALIGHLVRSHWAIENRLHRRRDVTLGEDASQVRTGRAPQVLAALNNTVLALMDHLNIRNVAAQQRIFAAQPHQAFALLLASDF